MVDPVAFAAPWQVRLRYGPELKDVAPQYAKQFEQALTQHPA